MGTPGSPLTIEMADGVGVVRFRERVLLDAEEIGRIQRELVSLVEQLNPCLMVIDLGNIQAISSKMIGVLVSAHQAAQQRGGLLVLCQPSRQIAGVLGVARLTDLFGVFPTLPAALQACAQMKP